MKAVFIESFEFTEWVTEYLADENLIALQRELIGNPETGDVMPGCSGLRKLRSADPKWGKGKRGGIRVIYLHVPEANVIYLITVYRKDQKDDLSGEERRLYRQLVQVLKQRARPSEGA
jgi:mRNA-degrading endonuclease RelE of RelBE toxin-antitoxin system